MALLLDRIQGGSLLDVGGACFPGRAEALSARVDKVVLLDVYRPPAPSNPNIQLVQCRIEDADESIGTFDHILLSNVLEHLDAPGPALKSVTRLLKPAGTVHILSPNCESLNRRIGTIMGELKSIREIPAKEIAIGHKHALSVADVREMISAAGLSLVECLGIFLKPVPTPEMISWPAGRIDAFFKIAGEIPPELCHEVYFRAAAR